MNDIRISSSVPGWDGATVLQVCFDTLIRSGYRDSRAIDAASMLLETLCSLPIGEGRIWLKPHDAITPPHQKLIDQLAALADFHQERDAVNGLALAYQYAIMMMDQRTRFSVHASRSQVINVNHEKPETIINLLWRLYEIQCADLKGVSDIARIEIVLDKVMSYGLVTDRVRQFDRNAEQHSSLHKFIDSMAIQADICIITQEEIQREDELPKPPPLDWSEAAEPNDDCRYNHVVAKTPIGNFQIEWKGWKEHDSFDLYSPFYDSHVPYHTLPEAKEKAYLWFTYYIRKSLGYSVREPK